MLKLWKNLNTTVIHETPWIQVKADECEVDGKVITYTYTKRKDEGPLIIAEENNKIWLVRQYRYPIKKFVWQFPVEGKTPEESWQAAAQRGITEEIGKKAQQLIEIGVFHPDPGGIEQICHCFYATNLESVDSTHHTTRDEIEDLEIKAFTLEEIETMVQSGEICDGWTLSGLYLFQKFKQSNTHHIHLQ